MGQILFPIFNRPNARLRSKTTGEFLAANLEALATIAEQVGVPPLSAFADSRPVPDGFDGSPDELGELLGPCDEWFEPVDGRRTVLAVADAIGSKAQDCGIDAAGIAGIEAELRDVADVLERASVFRLRFRLELR